ncbi:hypothetical protein, partial [Bacillus sp. SIMBA_005]|uniref:hypothetical protein n=1 Tax=Bacillus sp. SIMBA_005 TaxID=3085754 RepID=UPI00397C4A22
MKHGIKRRLAGMGAKRALSAQNSDSGFDAVGPIAVFAPTSHGSFGDEALVLGTGFLLDKLSQPWQLIAPGASQPWRDVG